MWNWRISLKPDGLARVFCCFFFNHWHTKRKKKEHSRLLVFFSSPDVSFSVLLLLSLKPKYASRRKSTAVSVSLSSLTISDFWLDGLIHWHLMLLIQFNLHLPFYFLFFIHLVSFVYLVLTALFCIKWIFSHFNSFIFFTMVPVISLVAALNLHLNLRDSASDIHWIPVTNRTPV